MRRNLKESLWGIGLSIEGQAFTDFLKENSIFPEDVVEGYFDKYPEDLDTFIEARFRMHTDLENSYTPLIGDKEFIKWGCDLVIENIKRDWEEYIKTGKTPNNSILDTFYDNDDEFRFNKEARFDIPIINKRR